MCNETRTHCQSLPSKSKPLTPWTAILHRHCTRYKTNMFYLVLAYPSPPSPRRGQSNSRLQGRIYLLNWVLRDLVALPPLDFSHLTLRCAEKRDLGDLSFPMGNLGWAPSSWQSCGCWHGREEIPGWKWGKLSHLGQVLCFLSGAQRCLKQKNLTLSVQSLQTCLWAATAFLIFAWWADKQRNPGRREGDRQSLSDLRSQNIHRWFGKTRGFTPNYFNLEDQSLASSVPDSSSVSWRGLWSQGLRSP